MWEGGWTNTDTYVYGILEIDEETSYFDFWKLDQICKYTLINEISSHELYTKF